MSWLIYVNIYQELSHLQLVQQIIHKVLLLGMLPCFTHQMTIRRLHHAKLRMQLRCHARGLRGVAGLRRLMGDFIRAVHPDTGLANVFTTWGRVDLDLENGFQHGK